MSNKPIFKTLWAERGAKREVDTSKIALGWTAERPPFQWENWSQWRQDAFIAHVNVRGIPEWDEETEYGVGVKSYVSGSNGEVYVSIAPSGGTYPARDPVLDVIKWKKAWLDADGTIGIPKVVGLQQALDNKVDKRDGYELSSNDYTSIEKSKLGGIEINAQRNVPANLSNSRTSSSVTITSSSGTNTTIGGASQTVSGVMVATDKAKLDGLPTGAGGLIPLSGGGTGSSNAAGARLALQLGNHSTHNYGTTANTVMMGNDSRVVRVNQDLAEGLATKADKTLNVSTGVGLVGGGNLSTNRTISANFGTTANTIAMGNDSRIINGQTSFERLDIGKTAATARTALELGAGATRWPSFVEVTGKPIHYPTTWDSVAAKPAQATRWPDWNELGGKPVQQGLGNSSTDIMSQKAITDAIGVVRGQSLGEGQTWRDVTSSRASGVIYTNTTGRSIVVSAVCQGDVGQRASQIFVDNVQVAFLADSGPSQGTSDSPLSAIIPSGSTYRIATVGVLRLFTELR